MIPSRSLASLSISLLTSLVYLTLPSCGGQKGGGGGQDGKKDRQAATAPDDAPPPFEDAEGFVDGLTHTFGAVVTEAKALDKLEGPFQVSTRRFLRVKGPGGDKSPPSTDALMVACKDLGVSLVGGEGKTWKPGTGLRIAWRSHLDPELLEDMGRMAITESVTFRCELVVSFEDERGENVSDLSFRFDPAPEATSENASALYTGSADLSGALTGGVMLLERVSPSVRFDSSWSAREVTDQAKIRLDVLAKTSAEVESTARLDESCDGAGEVTLRVELDSPWLTDVRSEGVTARTATGDGEDACSSLEPSWNREDRVASLVISCRLLDESACQLRFLWKDDEDPDYRFETFVALGADLLTGGGGTGDDLGGDPDEPLEPEEAVGKLPRAEGNPVRSGELRLERFDGPRKELMALAFDLILDRSPKAFDKIFANQGTVFYFDDKGPESGFPDSTCGQAGGALGTTSAFAPIGEGEVHWCSGKKLSDATVSSTSQSASAILFHAVTNLHEGLHAIGFLHDKDAPAYEPCEGTSYSAVVAVKTYECDLDYCRGLRDLAKAEYELEMDYSLGNDSRRRRGLCAEWAEVMD